MQYQNTFEKQGEQAGKHFLSVKLKNLACWQKCVCVYKSFLKF